MFTCKKALNQLNSYLDGELDEELKRALQAHLDRCEHCHVVFDTTRKTIELYCDGKIFSLPNEVHSRLHEALRRKLQQGT